MNAQELKNIPVLQVLPAADLERLAGVLEECRFDGGQVIVSEGDPGDAMYFIAEGIVRIEKSTQATGIGRKTLAVLSAGEYFGEMALFDQEPRSAAVVADRSVRLFRLAKISFNALLSESAVVGMGFLSAMIRTSNDCIRRLSSELVVYDEIGRTMGESTGLQALLDVVLQQLCRATLADWGLLLTKSQFAGDLVLRSVQGLQLSDAQKAALIEGRGIVSLVLEDPRELIARDSEEEEPFKSCLRLGFEPPALLLAPIEMERTLLGIIALGDGEPGRFDLNDLNLARGVIRQAGPAIWNALQREGDEERARLSRRNLRP